MAPEPPADAFAVLDSLQRQGIRLFLVGGYAVNALGFSRLTDDVDCLIVMDDLHKADALLRTARFSMLRKEKTHARYINPNLEPKVLDVLLVNGATFEKMWRERGFTSIRGFQFAVPKLQHLFAMKLHAVRGQRHRWGRDLRDIHELLQVNSGVVSKQELAEICRRFGPPDGTEAILEFIYGPNPEQHS